MKNGYRSAVHVFGVAGLLCGAITLGQIDRAVAGPPGPPDSVPVEVVNTPLEVDIGDAPIEVDVGNTSLDVEVTNTPSIEVIGFSSSSHSGGVGGVGILTSICQADFSNPEARVCSSEIASQSRNLTPDFLGDGAGWVDPSIVGAGLELDPTGTDPRWIAWRLDYSGLVVPSSSILLSRALQDANLNCDRWDSSDSGENGLSFEVTTGTNEEAEFAFEFCSVSLSVLCCAPIVD